MAVTTTTTNTLTSNERHPKRFFCCRPGYGRMPSAESGESSSSTNTASTSSSSSINSSIVHLSMPEEFEVKIKKNSSSSSSSSSFASSSSQTSSRRSKSPTPSTILSAILAKQRRKHHKPNSLNTIICCPSSLSKTVSAISEIDNFERIQLNNSVEKEEEEKIKKEVRGNGLFKKFGNIQKKFIFKF
uniref:Uncharacterized protein n=1 Tax=Meloidogyne enterolobii TaxID=390850 RepID=A0A6V7VK65_MELEN|nr:unnamed protein product [Meloidogyne enterolobii]